MTVLPSSNLTEQEIIAILEKHYNKPLNQLTSTEINNENPKGTLNGKKLIKLLYKIKIYLDINGELSTLINSYGLNHVFLISLMIEAVDRDNFYQLLIGEPPEFEISNSYDEIFMNYLRIAIELKYQTASYANIPIIKGAINTYSKDMPIDQKLLFFTKLYSLSKNPITLADVDSIIAEMNTSTDLNIQLVQSGFTSSEVLYIQYISRFYIDDNDAVFKEYNDYTNNFNDLRVNETLTIPYYITTVTDVTNGLENGKYYNVYFIDYLILICFLLFVKKDDVNETIKGFLQLKKHDFNIDTSASEYLDKLILIDFNIGLERIGDTDELMKNLVKIQGNTFINRFRKKNQAPFPVPKPKSKPLGKWKLEGNRSFPLSSTITVTHMTDGTIRDKRFSKNKIAVTSLSGSNFRGAKKYLKYKMKYINLKNKINI